MCCLFAAVLLASPWIESKDFSRELQEKAYSATLRLKTANGDVGTAVRVFRSDKGATYYLTAGHVVSGLSAVDLDWFDPKTGEVAGTVKAANVREIWPEYDLALLSANEPKEAPVLPISPLKRNLIAAPFPTISIGCPTGAPDLWLDEATAKVLVNREDLGNKLFCWQVKRESVGGRSGGPIIDKSGYVLGICSGNKDEKAYYVHVEEIQKCLKRGWAFIIPDESQKTPQNQKN